MKLKHAAQVGNDISVKVCSDLLDNCGPGVEYECIVCSIATTMLFHVFRLRLSESKEGAVEILRHVLGDVATNIKKTSGHDIRFSVEDTSQKE